jgi:diadenosine tetraphosphate (Ap4A) HIT family hydrolase
MTSTFKLHPRLANDCHTLAALPLCELLLMNNALLPWFILVPRVSVVELHQLTSQQQASLFEEINQISRFIEGSFSSHKLNVASIGNIVQQLHVHVIGRRQDDICWPGVVWGVEQRATYDQASLEDITSQLRNYLPADTRFLSVTSKP